jgi:hypothetical protein
MRPRSLFATGALKEILYQPIQNGRLPYIFTWRSYPLGSANRSRLPDGTCSYLGSPSSVAIHHMITEIETRKVPSGSRDLLLGNAALLRRGLISKHCVPRFPADASPQFDQNDILFRRMPAEGELPPVR